MKVANINSHKELISQLSEAKNSYLLLYKGDSEQSNCAKANLEKVDIDSADIKVYTADVAQVRDIHGKLWHKICPITAGV
jgi:hypothetical protein